MKQNLVSGRIKFSLPSRWFKKLPLPKWILEKCFRILAHLTLDYKNWIQLFFELLQTFIFRNAFYENSNFHPPRTLFALPPSRSVQVRNCLLPIQMNSMSDILIFTDSKIIQTYVIHHPFFYFCPKIFLSFD